ncbi:hypothetical protein [Kitasatospora sp. NPDC087314]|uniref:hypothetical protein n=1 Tax=Kitasatospora sp. NPDC087314 TaxID=3364068 RepID=UPI00381FF4DA
MDRHLPDLHPRPERRHHPHRALPPRLSRPTAKRPPPRTRRERPLRRAHDPHPSCGQAGTHRATEYYRFPDVAHGPALGGVGLLYRLQQYTAPDPDDCWEQDEVQAAADLLRTDPVEPIAAPDGDEGDEEPDGEDWEARDEAKRLRERVLSTWRGAATSLHLARAAIAMFPWLTQWAEPKLASKQQYLEALRAQAALFVDLEGLLAAAAAAAMEEPELPRDEAFSAIGTGKEVGTRLKALWREWQGKAGRGWEGPSARTY